VSLHIVYYWSGKLPRISELSIASALTRFPAATVDLWLDTDRGFESSFPDQLEWLRGEERFRLRFFSMEDFVRRCGFRPAQNQPLSAERFKNWIFQSFHNSSMRKNSFVRGLGDSAFLRPLLGHYNPIYGWFRAGPPSHTIKWAGAIYRDDLFKILIEREYPNADVLCADLDVYFAAPVESWPFDKSFTSRWGDEPWANNPVLFLHRHRPGISKTFHRLLEQGVPARPWHFFSDENCAKFGIEILDCAEFDPGWNPHSVSYARTELFMVESTSSKAFIDEINEYSLSVHWHNQWQTVPSPSSPYAHFLQQCKETLSG